MLRLRLWHCRHWPLQKSLNSERHTIGIRQAHRQQTLFDVHFVRVAWILDGKDGCERAGHDECYSQPEVDADALPDRVVGPVGQGDCQCVRREGQDSVCLIERFIRLSAIT